MTENYTPLSLRLTHEERRRLKQIAHSLQWSEHQLLKTITAAFLDQVQNNQNSEGQRLVHLVQAAQTFDQNPQP